MEALQSALHLATPEMFNTDQGVPVTAKVFPATLEAAAVQISRDGRGRVLDTLVVERLWRTVTYEDLSLNESPTVPDLDQGLRRSFACYHQDRPHQSLGYRVPAEVHCESV